MFHLLLAEIHLRDYAHVALWPRAPTTSRCSFLEFCFVEIQTPRLKVLVYDQPTTFHIPTYVTQHHRPKAAKRVFIASHEQKVGLYEMVGCGYVYWRVRGNGAIGGHLEDHLLLLELVPCPYAAFLPLR